MSFYTTVSETDEKVQVSWLHKYLREQVEG